MRCISGRAGPPDAPLFSNTAASELAAANGASGGRALPGLHGIADASRPCPSFQKHVRETAVRAILSVAMISVWQYFQRSRLVLRPGDGWRTGLVLALFAAAVQAIFLCETSHALFFRYPVVDAATYFYQALGILQGHGVSGVFWQPPGYSYLLAMFCSMGGSSVVVARTVQALLLAPLAAVLLWRISRRVLSPGWACVPVLVASLTGPLLFYFSQLLPAAPAAVLVLTILLLTLQASEQSSAVRWLLIGMINGLAMLFVATTAALVPVLAIVAWWCRRPACYSTKIGDSCGRDARAPKCRHALHVAALLLGVLLVITPVALRNYDACGKWVWISCNGGTNFYIGNCRSWEVTLTTQPGFDWDKLMRLPYLQNQVQDPVEADHQFARMAEQDIRRAPMAFLKRLAIKAAVFWHGREIPRNLDIYGWRETSRLLGVTVWRAGLNFPCGVLIPLALAGAYALRRRREGLLLAGSVLAFGLLVAIYFPCSRYRVPVLPIIVLLACVGTQTLVEAVRTRAWLSVSVLSIIILLTGLGANVPLHWPTDRIRYDAHLWNAMGVAADVRQDLATAKNCYEEAIRRDPRLADAQFNLGTVYTRQPDRIRAETCYEAAIAARADYDKAHVNLAIQLTERGQIAAALHHFELAELLNPLSAEAFANHAAALQRAGRDQEALEMLGKAAAIDSKYRARCRALAQSLGVGSPRGGDSTASRSRATDR